MSVRLRSGYGLLGAGCIDDRGRPVAQTDDVIDERLDPQVPRERRGEHDLSIGDRPLTVEGHRDTVQSDRPVIVHHDGPPARAPNAVTVVKKSC